MTLAPRSVILPTMKRGPLARYNKLVKTGALEDDSAQAEAVAALQRLHDRAIPYLRRRDAFIFRPKRPRGLYLWGGVGRGKTLLMDLFFNNTDAPSKRRVHFHEFMSETHDRIAAWRASDEKTRRRHQAVNRKSPDDPMPPVAHDIANDARLLCFDEFHVTDIADAMILGRLFTALFEEGVIVVATSNRTPDDLYRDGLNRQLFLPFIDLLKNQMDVLELRAAQDYRLAKLEQGPVYFHPLGRAADDAMDKAWQAMISGAVERSDEISVKGRTLKAPRCARGATRFTFAELCEQPLGAADYLALIRRYGALYLDHIPVMGPDKRNEAKRFVTLIDTLYDARAKLVCSADGPPEALYLAGDGSFEFERTTSRLMEMRTAEYLAAAREDPPAN